MKNLALLKDYFQVAFDETNVDSIRNEDFDLMCRRLNLAKGEKLLDIGCDLAVYAARNYGVNVLGITVNKVVHTRLNQVIAGSGLRGSAVKLMDYRNLVGVRFDKALCLDSSAMVRRKETVTLLGTIYNLLHPGGLCLLQCIAAPAETSSASIEPGGWLARHFGFILHPSSQEKLLTFRVVVLIARQIGFDIQLVEDLSETCLRQIRYWRANLQMNHHTDMSDTSETAFHDWNANLSILLDRIESGAVHHYQCLLSKPDHAHDHVSIPDSQRCCGLRNSE